MRRFYVGLHQVSDAHRFERACISIRRLWCRRKPLGKCRVLVDSGAFKELELHGEYQAGVEVYAAELHRLHTQGVVLIEAAVAQDYMCEAFMLARTGLTIQDHQRLTIERYDALVAELDRLFDGACPFPVMPVLQGYAPADYVQHLEDYGDRLEPGMWVGVGSVCKRNSAPGAISAVVEPIHQLRPDLRLHGFGVKLTALLNASVRQLFDTTDSMAWSAAARRQGRDSNSHLEAQAFISRIDEVLEAPPVAWQLQLL